MILFKKLRYKNLLSTGNVFTEINLNQSQTTLVVGANGAGKSSFLDALSFVLYGRPFRKINKNQLINTINNKNLVVEVEFSIGKVEYKIIRGIKPNVFEVYQNGTLVNQNADAREYQELLEKNVIKMNHKSFSQIVVLGSASFVPFMQLNAAHRREIIEDLLDIQIFSTMNTLLKERVSKNKSDQVDVDYQIKGAAEKIELHKKHIESLKTSNEELVQQKEAALKERRETIERYNVQIAETTAEIERYNDLIQDHGKVTKSVEEVRKLRQKLTDKYKAASRELAFFEENDECPTCKQGIHHEHKHPIVEKSRQSITQLEEAIQQLRNKDTALAERLDAILEISQTITSLQQDINNFNVQITINNQLITSIQEEIDALRTNTQQIDTNNEEIKQLKSALKVAVNHKEELLRDKQVLDIASTLLKDTGIKTKIIKQYIPVINKLINKYLAAMDFFVNFELNENFEETIKSRFRDEFTYDSFSEGEKSRLDLALLFAWRALAKLRNSASTNLLIFDEILDSSLDSNGLDEFMKIISGLTDDANVFIISHRETAADKFTNVIKFEKVKSFSRIAQ